MEIGFDLISDLNLAPDENFNWEGKATSLYCIVAGNVSSDLRTVFQTLAHLCRFYQGVFYTIGPLEYDGVKNLEIRTNEILALCKKIPNLAVLHHHVVIIDGIAILGANGWEVNTVDLDIDDLYQVQRARLEDIAYLNKSVEKLQKHLDVKKVFLVTNAVPKKQLYFGEVPKQVENQTLQLDYCLGNDTEMKVSHWAFGSYDKVVDTTLHNVNYINNSYFKRKPYWAKRINIKI
jgi:hypothetical protein